MTCDLVIRGGTVVSGQGAGRADVAIGGGEILAVGELGELHGATELDAEGLYVLPGVIDVHSHPVYSDDLAGMTAAGAAGGVTTVVPFIGAFPSWGFEKTTPLAVTSEYVARWDGRPHCDFGVHVAIDSVDDLGREIDALIDLGVTSFKFFMAYRTRGMMVGDDDLLRNFELIARRGGIAAVHAENGAGVAYLENRHWDRDDVDPSAFLECHTDLLEAEAILRAAALADAVACPLYIPHVAAGEGIDVIRIARRASRSPIWAETCPHYLLLTNDAVLQRGSLAKIAPPLRTPEDSGRLWAAVGGGDIDVVATDHACRTVAVKAQGRNLLQQPYGSEGIEHLLPLMYSDGVAEGRFDISRLVQVLCETPAEIFGLSSRKGRLAPGMDADVVLLDPRARTTVRAADHVCAADYCLYEGRLNRCSIERTLLRGTETFSRERGVASAGHGRFVARAPTPRSRARPARRESPPEALASRRRGAPA